MAARPYDGDNGLQHDEFPREIIEELVASLQTHAMRTYYAIVVPNRFTVTLHPDDYERIAPIRGLIVDEARRKLDEVLQRLNETGPPEAAASSFLDSLAKISWLRWLVRWLRPLAPEAAPEAVRAPAKTWFIEIHPTYEERFRPGQIDVFAQLDALEGASADAAGPDPGSIAAEGGATLGPQALAAGLSQPADDGGLTLRADMPQPRVKTVYARLHYQNDDGPQTFEIKKDRISMGRGGKGYWVDLEINFIKTDISRVHAEIRRDPARHTFEIKDLSKFGVTVNGEPVPPSRHEEGGEVIDHDIWVPLPPKAALVLADKLSIDFEIVPAETLPMG